MQRKPGYPIANCNIKMPDSVPLSEAVPCDDDGEQHQRRLQLINFAHAQWGFNNWSWSVSKQDLDFVDFASGKYCAGVVAFVSVVVKSLDIRRENIGYATCAASMKGSAIHQARKCAVTNALRETLLSFGGAVTSELLESLEARPEPAPQPCVEPPLPAEPLVKPEPKNTKNIRKDSVDSTTSNPVNRPPLVPIKNAIQNQPPPVAKALPMPANLPPAANRALAPRPPAPHVRPNSNEEEEEAARAERKRRQRQAQEEFRLRQLAKRTDDQDLNKGSSLDSLLLAIPTQEIVEPGGKRRTPPPQGASKRRAEEHNMDAENQGK